MGTELENMARLKQTNKKTHNTIHCLSVAFCFGKSWSFGASKYHHQWYLHWSYCRGFPHGEELLLPQKSLLGQPKGILLRSREAQPLRRSPGMMSGCLASFGSWDDFPLTVAALVIWQRSVQYLFCSCRFGRNSPRHLPKTALPGPEEENAFSQSLLPAEQSLVGVPVSYTYLSRSRSLHSVSAGSQCFGGFWDRIPFLLFHWGRDPLAVAVQ